MTRRKVLIIDDDKDLCLLITRELKQENYDITICYNGQAGIEAFKNEEYHIRYNASSS